MGSRDHLERKGLAGGLTLHSIALSPSASQVTQSSTRRQHFERNSMCILEQKEAMSVHVSNEVNGRQKPSLPHRMGQTEYTTCGYQIQEKESAAHTSASRPRPALLQETCTSIQAPQNTEPENPASPLEFSACECAKRPAHLIPLPTGPQLAVPAVVHSTRSLSAGDS